MLSFEKHNLNQLLAALFLLCGSLFSKFNFANKSGTLKFRQSNSQLTIDTPILDFNGTLSLKDNSANTVSGSNITFADGILKSGDLLTEISGNYNATLTDSIDLSGNHEIDIRAGEILVPVNVSGTGNQINGSPIFQQEITLANSGTDVSLAIYTNLSQNINLNGGTIILNADLKLEDSAKFIGAGTINSNGKRLSLSSTLDANWTSDLTFVGDNELELNAVTAIVGSTWNFSTASATSSINGNGNILDLGSTGTIQLANDHTLYINNAVIKGLGDGASFGKFVMGNDGATVRFNNVTIELVDDYTLSTGKFYFEGANPTMYVKSFDFNITGGANLTIDGVAFIWDKLNISNTDNPILPAAPANQTLLSGGVIRSVVTPASIAVSYSYSASAILDGNVFITDTTPVTFTNPSPAMPHNITLQGNGHLIQFMRTDSSQNFVLDDNVNLTLEHVVLKDFNPASVQFGTSASLTFGDGVTLELGKDIAFNNSYNFNGDVIIDGKGANLTLSHDDSILFSGASKTLTLKDLNLHGLGGAGVGGGNGRLRALATGNIILLQDCQIFMDADYTLSQSSLNVSGHSKLIGDGFSFIYTSQDQSHILADSVLEIDRGVTFIYQANPASLSLAASRNRVKLDFASSQILLHGSTLHSKAQGINLDTGKLTILDHSTLKSDGVFGSTFELALQNSLNLTILAGAQLDIEGDVLYE